MFLDELHKMFAQLSNSGSFRVIMLHLITKHFFPISGHVFAMGAAGFQYDRWWRVSSLFKLAKKICIG